MLTSIRSRLILLILLLLLPAAGIIVATSIENRRLTLQKSATHLQHLADNAKKDLEVSFKHARRMHFALQQNTQILQLQSPACADFLHNILVLSNELSAVSISDFNGRNLCPGSTADAQPNTVVPNRAFFKRAIVSDQAIVELPILESTSGKYSLPVAGLIRNAQGERTGVLLVAIDLDKFSQKLAQEVGLQKAIIELLDGAGNVIFHFPHTTETNAIPAASMRSIQAAMWPIKEWGLFEEQNANNEPAIMALSMPTSISPNTQLVISVGMQKVDFYQPADYYLWQALGAVAALLLFGLAAIWMIGDRLIFHPVKQLLATAKRIDAGDFSANVGAPYANNEIGALARILDHMANATSTFMLETKEKNQELDQRVTQRTVKLELQNDRLKVALEIGQLGIWEKDLKTNHTTSNVRHAQIFGYTELPKDWSTSIFLEHVFYEDREKIRIAHQTALQCGQYAEEFRIVWADSSVHWLSDMCRVTFDADGQPIRMLGVSSDISPRKIIEASLIAGEQHFRQIVDMNVDSIIVIDQAGKINYLNQQTERIFGYDRPALLGENIKKILPQGFHRQHNNDLPIQHNMIDQPLIGRRRDASEFLADITLSDIELAGRKMLMATIRDVSVRAQSEKEILRLNRILQTLSQCNEVLVRADKEATLLNTICDTLVQIGNYPAAFIVLKTENPEAELRVAAATNNSNIKLPLDDGNLAEHSGVLRRIRAVIDSGKAEVMSKIDTEDFFQGWQQEVESSSFTAFAVVPLLSKSGIHGVLLLQSGEVHSFDEQEMTLLKKLADNIAYGLIVLQEKIERQLFADKLYYQENFDVLTGLANRHLFSDRLTQNMLQASRNNKMVAVLFFNIDRFQLISDSIGHPFGEKLIQLLAQRLTALLREGDTVGRLNSSDFGIILSNLDIFDNIMVSVNKVMQTIGSSFLIDNTTLFLTASMGVSVYPKDGDQMEMLMKYADLAMHSAIRMGGNMFQFYSDEINSIVTHRMAIETNLRNALEQQELSMYFQPKVSLKTGKITGAEALIRWSHPTLGIIPPSDFIPQAEETGLILAIGAWTLTSTCEHMRNWLDMGIEVPPISVNLSPRQFRDENLIEMISQTISTYQINPALLIFEITESSAMMDVEKGILILNKLKSLGIKLSVDDFGTGYSSLSYLKRLPLDQLKIDRAFVKDISSDPNDKAICLAIIGLAHTLKMSVVAEGVETEAQMHILRQHHCDELQGFIFSKAVPASEFAEYLCSNHTLNLPNLTPIKQQTILLVDDEQNILSALKRLLRRDGYHILTATSGAEGLELLAQNNVDVIMSDQRMPGMIGADFLRRSKELYPSTVRIMLSGYTELQSVTDAVNEGAIYKFLTKPWEDELLRVHIQEAFKLKGIYDENQNLNEAVVIAKNELEIANRKMETILEQKMAQISRVEVNLSIVREVLQKIPFAVIGVDDESMIAFVNNAAEALFRDVPLLGCTVNEVLPELSNMLMQNNPPESISVNVAGDTYCAAIHSMGSESETTASSKLIIFQPKLVLQ